MVINVQFFSNYIDLSKVLKITKEEPSFSKRSLVKPSEFYNHVQFKSNYDIDPMKSYVLVSEKEYTLIEKIKKSYTNLSDNEFIDELMFISFQRLCKNKIKPLFNLINLTQ